MTDLLKRSLKYTSHSMFMWKPAAKAFHISQILNTLLGWQGVFLFCGTLAFRLSSSLLTTSLYNSESFIKPFHNTSKNIANYCWDNNLTFKQFLLFGAKELKLELLPWSKQFGFLFFKEIIEVIISYGILVSLNKLIIKKFYTDFYSYYKANSKEENDPEAAFNQLFSVAFNIIQEFSLVPQYILGIKAFYNLTSTIGKTSIPDLPIYFIALAFTRYLVFSVLKTSIVKLYYSPFKNYQNKYKEAKESLIKRHTQITIAHQWNKEQLILHSILRRYFFMENLSQLSEFFLSNVFNKYNILETALKEFILSRKISKALAEQAYYTHFDNVLSFIGSFFSFDNRYNMDFFANSVIKPLEDLAQEYTNYQSKKAELLKLFNKTENNNQIELKRFKLFLNNSTMLDFGDIKLTPGIYAVTGRNGVGKSTTFKFLSMVISPNIVKVEGQIFYPKDLKRYSINQNIVINHEISLLQNIFGINLSKVDPNKLKEASFMITDILKLQPNEIYKEHQLSGGQVAIINLIQAIMEAPNFLLLDESSASLDPSNKNLLFDLLKEKLKETIILHITQEPSSKFQYKGHIDIDTPKILKIATEMYFKVKVNSEERVNSL